MKKLILCQLVILTMSACGGSGSTGTSPISTPSSIAATSSSSSSSSSSVSSSSLASSSSSAPASNWELVWSDEFDGNNIDLTKWSFEQNCTGGGNNELECYTARPDNAYVSNGNLHIVAKKETFHGQAKNNDDPGYDPNDTSVTRDYTSARLRTKNKGDWKYGRMEIRAKLPQGQGMWPAIWMLPTDWVYGSWPLSGEIDIMEAIDSNTGTNGSTVYGTLHYGDAWPNNKHSGDSTSPATNLWDNYHTYTVEWEDGEVRWYVDDKHYITQTKSGWYTSASTIDGAPFNQRFHMILNLAIGGSWPGNPDANTVFPQEMLVDYVRVYQCKLDTVTGKGCASNVNPAIKPLTGFPPPTQAPAGFAAPPLFAMYGDQLAAGLKVDSYNPNGQISYSEIAEAGHGNVFNVVKTGATGNVYFNVTSGAANLSTWNTGGVLIFNLKVNSMADGTKLLVKMDSGWPSVSDVAVTLPPIGTWGEFRINVSDLIARGNSIQTGIANLSAITNIFVIEPSAAMDVSFDNIRLETP